MYEIIVWEIKTETDFTQIAKELQLQLKWKLHLQLTNSTNKTAVDPPNKALDEQWTLLDSHQNKIKQRLPESTN